jgi:hypothetical protein
MTRKEPPAFSQIAWGLFAFGPPASVGGLVIFIWQRFLEGQWQKCRHDAAAPDRLCAGTDSIHVCSRLQAAETS